MIQHARHDHPIAAMGRSYNTRAGGTVGAPHGRDPRPVACLADSRGAS